MYTPYNPFEIVKIFEQQMADYTGAKYAIATDTGTSAIELACTYLKVDFVTIPKHTYISVPQAIIRAGGKVLFDDIEWLGEYRLEPYPIIDSALRLRRHMHTPGTFRCLSFHYRKILDIGRGGMILFDDDDAINFFKQKRYHGRQEFNQNAVGLPEHVSMLGNSYNMEPTRAADGLHRMLYLADNNSDIIQDYQDISGLPIYE